MAEATAGRTDVALAEPAGQPAGPAQDPAARAWLLSSRRLHLTLFATELCNFRCTYCYEDHTGRSMDADVQQAICRLIDRRAADLEELVISWFGGEPLMVPAVVLNVNGHAKRVATEHGIRLSSGATTNGWYLNPELTSQLLEVGVSSFQITLDGPPEHHDRTRIRRGGLGSFDRVWANLIALRNSALDFRVRVRCHVTGDNADDWEAFAPSVRELCDDPRFQAHVHAVGALGGPNDAEFHFAPDGAVGRVRNWLGLSGGSATGEICYAAIPSAVIVRADGTLNRCTVALTDSRNQVGRLGPDGELFFDQARQAPWFAGWAGDDRQLACPMRFGVSRTPAPAALQLTPVKR